MLCGAIECSPLADKRTCGFGMSCVRLGCAFDHPEGQHHTLLNYQEFEEMRQSRRQRFLSKPGGVCHTMMADVVATAEDGTLQTDGNVLGSLQSKSELLCGGIVALKGQIQQIKTKLNMCFKALVQVGVDIRNDVYHSLLRVKADSATEEMFDQVKDSYNTLAVEVKELHDKLSGIHQAHTSQQVTLVEVPKVQHVDLVRQAPLPQTQRVVPEQVPTPVVQCREPFGEVPQVALKEQFVEVQVQQLVEVIQEVHTQSTPSDKAARIAPFGKEDIQGI